MNKTKTKRVGKRRTSATKHETRSGADRKKAAVAKSAEQTIHVWATVLQKLDAKRNCKILRVAEGLVTFRYRRPGSKKHNVETVAAESLIQYGKDSDGNAWIWRHHEELIETFTAVSVKRTVRGIECDLGEGVLTILNPKQQGVRYAILNVD